MRFVLLAVLFLPSAHAADETAQGQRTVLRVIDGDTIVLDGGETVRLIGIDAPEVASKGRRAQCYALMSAGYLSKLLEKTEVRIEGDSLGDEKDKYGRTLAYVFLNDGRLLNSELVRRGYARAYTKFPFRYADLFVSQEQAAKKARAGLWGRC